MRTGEGEVKIAGTSEFRLTSAQGGSVDLAVNKGQLRVVSAAGEKTLEPAQPAVAVAPQPPAPEPVAVRPRPIARPKPTRIAFPQSVAPKIDAHFTCLMLRDVPLKWTSVAGATGYKVMVARDLSFRSVVDVREVKTTAFSFTPPGPGTYVWRVAARDARGYSEYGFARRMFCDR